MDEELEEIDDDAMYHFGVKGMHWGSRKSHDNSRNAGYTVRKRTVDAALGGGGSVRRINRDLNAGKTHSQARKSEAFRKAKMLAGAAAVVGVLALVGQKRLSGLAIESGNLKAIGNGAAHKVLNNASGMRF